MKKTIPFIVQKDNRSYLRDKDNLLLNCFIEKKPDGIAIVKRPGFKNIKTITSIVTGTRGIIYSEAHGLFYICIGDALFSLDSTLTTVTEIVRKTPTSVTWSAAAGGTFTYVFAAAHGFTAAQQVYISGVTPAVYSGTKTITAVTTTSVANDTFTVTGVGADPGASTLTNARVSPILSTSGKVYFEIADNSGASVVMMQIPKTSSLSSQLFQIASAGVVTRVTDADYPINAVGACVYLDGYVFTLAETTSTAIHRLYNSDLVVPASWTALGYANVREYPDPCVTAARINNQIACLKQKTIEFFYNAANATGSPLSQTSNATLNIGCASAESVVVSDNIMIWLSRDSNSGLSVHLYSGGLQKISTPFVDRVLASVEAIINEGNINAFLISYEGHKFYILTIDGSGATGTAIPGLAIPGEATPGVGASTGSFKRTLVYDLTENQWHEWSTNDGSDLQISFFGYQSISGPAISSSQNYTNTLVIHKTNGDIYEMSPQPIGSINAVTYKDGSLNIRCEIVTDNLDGGTQDKKRCSSLELIGDEQTSTSNINVYWSDDDYKNYSSARTIDMSDPQKITRLGSFKRRAWKFVHESDTPMKLSGFEIDIERGTH